MLAPYYVTVIKQTLSQRQRVNSRYSLRALAMSLSMAPGILSSVLNLKRNLPLKYVDKIIDDLNLSSEESKKFKSSLKYSRLNFIEGSSKFTLSDKNLLSEIDDYHIIAEWEYYAVFKLLDTKYKMSTPNMVAKKLAISTQRAREILATLMRRKYIAQGASGEYRKLVEDLTTTSDVPSRAIRASHKETLSLAGTKIDQVDIERRYYSSTTIAIDNTKIDEAKTLYRDFREKMSALLVGEEATEVYQFSFQLFPLTKLENSQ